MKSNVCVTGLQRGKNRLAIAIARRNIAFQEIAARRNDAVLRCTVTMITTLRRHEGIVKCTVAIRAVIMDVATTGIMPLHIAVHLPIAIGIMPHHTAVLQVITVITTQLRSAAGQRGMIGIVALRSTVRVIMQYLIILHRITADQPTTTGIAARRIMQLRIIGWIRMIIMHAPECTVLNRAGQKHTQLHVATSVVPRHAGQSSAARVLIVVRNLVTASAAPKAIVVPKHAAKEIDLLRGQNSVVPMESAALSSVQKLAGPKEIVPAHGLKPVVPREIVVPKHVAKEIVQLRGQNSVDPMVTAVLSRVLKRAAPRAIALAHDLKHVGLKAIDLVHGRKHVSPRAIVALNRVRKHAAMVTVVRNPLAPAMANVAVRRNAVTVIDVQNVAIRPKPLLAI